MNNVSRRMRLLTVLAVLATTAAIAIPASGSGGTHTYEVTITNLTDGQPLSPPVAVTHNPRSILFRVGGTASPAIEAIAEDGNQSVAVDALLASQAVFPFVRDVVDVGQPLTPAGTTPAGFTDTVTFQIDAGRHDRLSIGTMLICTNDGFTGLDRAKLPSNGSKTYELHAYDAGTEDNTEMSSDMVDPCSGLGPFALAGDPNGNENAAVDTSPQHRIKKHAGIAGGSDLSVADHGWGLDAIAIVTITKLP